MNFALDALWWRLTEPRVRDLASILTAPPLWQTDCELPVQILLGEHGFRYLLDLNDDVCALPDDLAHDTLGRYAENLLAFWLATAPHSRLLGRDVVVSDNQGRTLGALDCVAELNGMVYHIELACKYFGGADGLPEQMVGLNTQDTLLNKINKLNQQLALSETAQARAVLADLGVKECQRVSVVRGMGFTHSGVLPSDAVYPCHAWSGRFWHDGQDVEMMVDKRFYRLARNAYLAPARVAECDLQAWGGAGLWAEMVLRPDGYWHEVGRWMCLK